MLIQKEQPLINNFPTIGYPCRKQQGITPIVASGTGRRMKGSRLFSLAYIPDASIGVLRFTQIKLAHWFIGSMTQ